MPDINDVIDLLSLMRSEMVTKEELAAVRADIARLENEHGSKLDVLLDGQKTLIQQKAQRDKVDDLADEVRFLKKMCYNL